MGRGVEDGLKLIESLLARLGGDEDPAESSLLGKLLVRKVELLAYAERVGEALIVADAIIARFENNPEHEARQFVANALLLRWVYLATLGRMTECESAYEQVVDEYADEALEVLDEHMQGEIDPRQRPAIASALMAKAGLLDALDREEESKAVCAELLRRFGNDDDLNIALVVATARELHAPDDE